MRQKLLSGEYRAPVEFISDIELIFTNAKSYNAKGSEVSIKDCECTDYFPDCNVKGVKCMNALLLLLLHHIISCVIVSFAILICFIRFTR